jgi:hypothetical protein
MAEVTLRRCDVFHTLSEENKEVTVIMKLGDADPENTDLFYETRDMSPRAIERAKNFLKRATSPPPPPKAKADA